MERMIRLNLESEGGLPLRRQICRQLREMILRGELPASGRLPSTRQLAADNQVARITVSQAYDQLAAEGFINKRPGAGAFVTDAMGQTSFSENAGIPPLTDWGQRLSQQNGLRKPNPRIDIDFGFGRSFASIFPYDIWRRLLARYLSADDAILSRYGSVAGLTSLRQAVADYVRRQRGARCQMEQVIIVNGGQQALDILARLLLNPGDSVGVETPGYAEAYALFKLHGARLQPFSVDNAGFPAEQLPENEQEGAMPRLLFVTPSNQFPRGGAMSLPRRLQLLDWAVRHGALIVEDDYDGELRYTGQPLPALQGLTAPERVIYLGTFSKVLFPALRLGYVILPKPLIEPFVRAMALLGRGAPTLTQAAVADFISEGHFERHVARLRRIYGERRQILTDALCHYLPDMSRFSPDAAGLHVMLYLPASLDESWVTAEAAKAGVGVYGGRRYHLTDAPPSILLGYSGLSEEEIVTGARLLAEAVKRGASSGQI